MASLVTRAPQVGEQVVDPQGRVLADFAVLLQQLARALQVEQEDAVDLSDEVDALALDLAAANSDITSLEGRATALEGDVAALEAAQTWADVSASRAASTSYQNTGARPMQIAVAANVAAAVNVEASPDNATWVAVGIIATNQKSNVNAIIPPGWYYRVNGAVTGFDLWAELA